MSFMTRGGSHQPETRAKMIMAHRRNALTLEQRFWAKVDKSAGDGSCWAWLGAATTGGYGTFTIRSGYSNTTFCAHRVSYLLLVGCIPPKMQLDHLCRNRKCVNPRHLEVVTGKENNLRSESVSAKESRVTNCPAGHPYDEMNTYRHRGHRQCNACRAVHTQAADNRAAEKRRIAKEQPR